MGADYIYLRGKYGEIRSLCVTKLEFYREYTAMGIFSKIIDIYKAVLTEYEKFYLRRIYWECDDISEDDIYVKRNSGIAREIKKVYHSVWMEDAYEKEDVYFLSMKRAKLLDWDDDENPYKELQQLKHSYRKEVAGRGRDIVKLFEEMSDLLKQDLPLDDFVQKADECLRKCFIFLFGV